MAQVANVPSYVATLLTALEDRFPGSKAEVGRIRGLDAYAFRVGVLGTGFVDLILMSGHDQAWEVAERVLTREQRLRISMILCLAPDEVREDEPRAAT